MTVDMNFMIAGEAGQGIQSVGYILAKTFLRGGYYVFADQDSESRVRGGHNFYRVRIKDSPVQAVSERVDLLISFDSDSVALYRGDLIENGVIVVDEAFVKDISDSRLMPVPLKKLAEQQAGSKLMENTVALGAVMNLTGYPFKMLEAVLREQFKDDVAEANVKAARAGYEYMLPKEKQDAFRKLKPIDTSGKRMLMSGNEAIALGALASGCKFIAAYPMTPGSSIMEYLATKSEEFGIVVLQSEDEIAAINSVIGAGYAGVRAMTATSGGGFCLMVEGLGLAGMTETPVVIVNAQRPGPAIGLPTRTEQGDLEFVIHASHGEFPRAVFAPANAEDAFWLTVKAFNVADKHQIPVILLTDQHIAMSYFTVENIDLSAVSIDRGILFKAHDKSTTEYKRYALTESGISPRAFPGTRDVLVVADSDEHDESGHPIEDAETRNAQMQKRLRKIAGIKSDISTLEIYGSKDADVTLIGWGSSRGAIREAVDILQKESLNINMIQLNELWPFPAGAVAAALEKTSSSYVVESNATGQLAYLIRAETGKLANGKILRYDGRPLTPAQIVRDVKKEVY